MPTHESETLLERYAREWSVEVAYLQHDRNNLLDQIEHLRGLLREALVKFESYQKDGLKVPVNLMRRIREDAADISVVATLSRTE